MTPSTKEDTPKSKETESKTSAYAILFELEGFAADGRGATFQVLKSLLSDQQVKLDPVLFSRYCLHAFPENYLSALLQAMGSSKKSPEKLADDVRSGLIMELSSKSNSLNPAFRALIETAKGKGVSLAAISALPEEKAKGLLGNLGLTDLGVELFCFPEVEDSFPRADCWLKVAKALGKKAVHCGVIAGSQTAAKSALSAGMPCVAVPDTYTSFQDFSGVNAICDDLTEGDVAHLLDTLCPHL